MYPDEYVMLISVPIGEAPYNHTVAELQRLKRARRKTLRDVRHAILPSSMRSYFLIKIEALSVRGAHQTAGAISSLLDVRMEFLMVLSEVI